MKKIKVLMALLIFGIAVVSADAQITFGAWGRAVITPLAFMGEHSSVSAATSTWGDVPSIGFSARGVSPSGNIGFNIDFDFGVNIAANNAPAIIGDNAKAWVKPLGLVLPEQFNMLKLTAGFFKEEEFRGKIGASEFASWLIYRKSRYFLEWGSPNEDTIFQRFDAIAGAHFKLEPLKWWDSPWNGLNIQGAFGSTALGAPGNNLQAILNLLNNEDNNTITGYTYDEKYPAYDGDRKVSAADVFRAIQIALGYRIPNAGLARIQFIGNNREVFRWAEQGGGIINRETKLMTGLSTNKNADIIEIAFLYDGMDGLKVDAGMKIPLEYTTKNNFIVYPRVVGSDGKVNPEIDNSLNREYTVQIPYVAALGASWTPSFLPALNLTTRIDASFGGTIKSETDGKEVKNGMVFDIWLMPSYEIMKNFKVGVDIAMDLHGLDTLKEEGKNPEPFRTEVSEFIDFGVGPWFELGVGGGRVRTGIIVMLPGSARYRYNSNYSLLTYSPILTGEPVISIPISFTYSF
ncbi:MAG: hypothetical protein LBD18_06800 [Treponema sp.]|nr:hypothetical protein [Treponema sp.]